MFSFCYILNINQLGSLLRYQFLHHLIISIISWKHPFQEYQKNAACLQHVQKDLTCKATSAARGNNFILYKNCRYQRGWRLNDGNEDACRKTTLSMCWGPSVTKFSQQDCQGEKTCTRGWAVAPWSLVFTKVKYNSIFSITKLKIKTRTDSCWE